MQTRIPPHSHCDACGEPIHYGQPIVCVCRNTEQRDYAAGSSLDQVTVTESLALLSLCPACSALLPDKALAQLLCHELKLRRTALN